MRSEKLRDKGINVNHWVLSFAINIAALVMALLLANVTYESNDDFFISKMITDGYPYIGFINYYLCKILIAIQSVLTEVNVFILFLIAASFLSFTYVSKIVIDSCDNIAVRALIIPVLIVFSFDHYSAIQFTKTSALVMTAGFIGLVNCVINKRGMVSYAVGILFIYLGAAIRNRTFPAVFGTACTVIIIWMFIERKSHRKENWFGKRNLITTAGILIFVLLTLGIIRLSYIRTTGTEELKNAEDYSTYRSNILDYPTFKYYDQNREKYEAIGVSENDMFLIDNWRLDYEGAATLENLKAIDSFERPKTDIRSGIIRSVKKALRLVYDGALNRTTTGIHIITLALIAASMIAALKPRHWIFVLSVGAVTFGLYVFLYYKQRAIYRAVYIADIGAALWLIYYYSASVGRSPKDYHSRIGAVMTAATLIIVCFLIGSLSDNCMSKYERTAKRVMDNETIDYFTDHKDTVFVYGTGEKKRTDRYIKPLLAPDHRDDNLFDTGGWETMSPYILDRLKKYGMYNPIKDLIDNNHALYMGNKHVDELELYLNDWYASDGSVIRMKEVDKVDGIRAWKVVRVKEKN